MPCFPFGTAEASETIGLPGILAPFTSLCAIDLSFLSLSAALSEVGFNAPSLLGVLFDCRFGSVEEVTPFDRAKFFWSAAARSGLIERLALLLSSAVRTTVWALIAVISLCQDSLKSCIAVDRYATPLIFSGSVADRASMRLGCVACMMLRLSTCRVQHFSRQSICSEVAAY